jgi:hypothetical protein
MLAFTSMRSTPFMEVDEKGGEIVQRYKSLRERLRRRSKVGNRGSNIKECEWIKILGQEKHTSRGSKLMNLFVLHLICA